MIRGSGKKIIMTEGDFGLTLPIIINGTTFENTDKIKMKIKKSKDRESIFEKEYEDIVENTINFCLSKEESEMLKPATYFYTLDWYDSGDNFLCNIVSCGELKVEDKY